MSYKCTMNDFNLICDMQFGENIIWKAPEKKDSSINNIMVLDRNEYKSN